jgi:predicted TIM-barrel fold metal-dependent hydrolase
MVTAMEAAGVDGAILVSPYSIYRYDDRYARAVHAHYPGKFRMVKPINPKSSTIEATVEAWASTPGAVGVRLMLPFASSDPDDTGLNRVIAAAARHSLAVNLHARGRLDQVAGLAARNRAATIVVDHLGLAQPMEPPVPADAFADLPKLLALAASDNIRVKLTGVFTLSSAPYPFRDVWAEIKRVVEAFGCHRCMWGTDWTRTRSFLSYSQAVEAFEAIEGVSAAEKADLMGGTLVRTYRWAETA